MLRIFEAFSGLQVSFLTLFVPRIYYLPALYHVSTTYLHCTTYLTHEKNDCRSTSTTRLAPCSGERRSEGTSGVAAGKQLYLSMLYLSIYLSIYLSMLIYLCLSIYRGNATKLGEIAALKAKCAVSAWKEVGGSDDKKKLISIDSIDSVLAKRGLPVLKVSFLSN